jgi:UDP-N-acetylmuramate: L-alanyl-gamma-D-glutamyl-meso-diaminopimelate ligase
VPGNGLIIENGDDANLAHMLALGCWTPRETFAVTGSDAGWQARLQHTDGSCFEVLLDGTVQGRVTWGQLGLHNVQNALAAIAAARHAGVPAAQAIAALAEFRGIKRRLEVRGTVNGVTVYDDFAHHPTAIAATLAGLRNRVGAARILLVLEPRSNTMRMGVHRNTLAASLADADLVWLHEPPGMDWSLADIATGTAVPVMVSDNVQAIVDQVVQEARPGEHILVMSNGAFGGIHLKLLEELQKFSATPVVG